MLPKAPQSFQEAIETPKARPRKLLEAVGSCWKLFGSLWNDDDTDDDVHAYTRSEVSLLGIPNNNSRD